jgi:hypothetical protein
MIEYVKESISDKETSRMVWITRLGSVVVLSLCSLLFYGILFS